MPSSVVVSSTTALLVGLVAALWTLSWDPPALLWDAAPAYQPVHISLGNDDAAVRRLAHGLTFATVSDRGSSDHLQDPQAMAGLHAHIEQSFPLVHSTLAWEKVWPCSPHSSRGHPSPNGMGCVMGTCGVLQVNEWSLLYTWRGTNSSLKPLLCISHLDVVPVTSEAAWTQPPFGGSLEAGCGRGFFTSPCSLS